MEGAARGPAMEEPRYLADAMLGRLARYLRMLGYDTEYSGEGAAAAIREALARDPRILLTRNGALAAATPGSVRLREVLLDRQLRELAGIRPPLRSEPRFDRCTACNGPLAPEPGPGDDPVGAGPARRAGPGPVWRCRVCGHRYWEGTHTARIRADLRRTLGTGDPR